MPHLNSSRMRNGAFSLYALISSANARFSTLPLTFKKLFKLIFLHAFATPYILAIPYAYTIVDVLLFHE